MSNNYHEFITSLLIFQLLNFAASQSPPVKSGDIKQYFLMPIHKNVNLTCPFTEVSFYKWNNLKNPSHSLADSRTYQIKLTSDTKAEIFECEAVNGYGKRTAIFITKGFNVKSSQFEVDCKSNEAGPCFLASSLNNNFKYDIDEGDKVAFDCRSIANTTVNKNPLTYTWRRIPSHEAFASKQPTTNDFKNPQQQQQQMLESVPVIEKQEETNFNDMNLWGQMVYFEKVTKDMDGIYTCSVSNGLAVITRTFRLNVKEVKTTNAIDGPHHQNISASVGSTQLLMCKASNSLSKPKWGKKIEKNDPNPDQSAIIKWEDNRYRILQGSLDIEHKDNGGLMNDAKYYENNLKLENIGKDDIGTYICSVLTRSSTPETKFVYLTLKTGDVKEGNNFPLYIIGPIAVFVICFGTVVYCLIRRKLNQDASFKNRAGRGTTITTNTSSANGSSSGSRNTSNPRQHMLPTSTASSKNFQPQYVPTNEYNTNPTSGSQYASNYPAFAAGYTPAVMNYNYTGHGQYITQANSAPGGIGVDHPCSHHTCLSHNNQNVPYDSDTTPSPPPPTSVTDTISTVANNNNTGNQNMMPPYSMSGVSVNSYSPNQSSQVYSSHQPSQVSSNGSSSISTSNAPYLVNSNPLSSQQPLYTIGNMYSA